MVMADRERVTYDIERCICHVPDACRDCSHYWGKKDGDVTAIDCMEELMADALAMLKEQETVKSTSDDTESIKPYAQGDGSYACNNCGETVGWEEMNCGGISLVKYKYCPECGRRIRWNG